MFEKNINKIVGIKQCIKFLKESTDVIGAKVYIAEDADKKLLDPLIKIAEEKNSEIHYIATMKDLGQLCNIDVGAAAAVLND
ncbi:large subunit ribosomal protein L7A [Hathewaya proteolytica DSM 3090]|uniref:Large subunit ribosomal protein L7A n=1 Tax=Hathewaya proteolytica DSM 3090 TaxID=1121331 RepID=A0A1M6T265_9CLOT|nr:ribosomal L7Ae/L30e/S12e/Gadd45 family protein [Hathewaya proteolytica]SHK50898.1 large subunit ribosomal protein L7A [Hathewaya proteolytica DSM 3090]